MRICSPTGGRSISAAAGLEADGGRATGAFVMERSVPVVLLRRRPVERRLNIVLWGRLWSLWLCWNEGSVRKRVRAIGVDEHLSVAE